MTQTNKQIPASPRQAGRRRAAVDTGLDATFFKALADPTRARILACLVKCGRACSVTEVAACCAVDFSVVARHLTTLARAGLVESRKEGRVVWTVARSDALVRRLRDLADAVEEWIRDDDGCRPGCCAAPGSGR